jgi:hypothetical protein
MMRILPLLLLLAACRTSGGARVKDEEDQAETEGAEVARPPAVVLAFNGPKAGPGGTASAPVGTLHGLHVGDVVAIQYAPQRIRGCDGGGWGQENNAFFLDATGKQVGEQSSGSAFTGIGMVPVSQPVLILRATVPQGAVKLHVEARNTGDHHDPEDTADPGHSGPGDNFSPDGSTCSDDPGPGLHGWDIPVEVLATAAPAAARALIAPQAAPAAQKPRK